MSGKLQDLPIANKKRQGALHAAIRYQYLKTVLAWISLEDDDGYVVTEWIDDVFVADRGRSVISDAKYINSVTSLTLRSQKFLDCLDNAYTHLVENSARPEVRYSIVTNLSAGNENPSLPNLGKCGLSAWDRARQGESMAQEAIIHYLLNDSCATEKIKRYLRENSTQDVWEYFLGRVYVDVDAGDLLQSFRSIEGILKSRCDRYNLPRVGIPSFIQHLESVVADAASRSTNNAQEPRKLMLDDFYDAWDKSFMRMHIPYAKWCNEAYGTTRLSVLEEADFWLDERIGSGYSRRELIERGLAYFCPDELASQERMVDLLVGNDFGGIVAISGSIGTGKTLLAASLAVRLSSMLYQVYYTKVNAETQPSQLISEIEFAQERCTIPIVVILDNCHRNYEVIVQLQLRRSRIRLPAILFIANTQDRFLQEQYEIEYSEVKESFSNTESHFSTNLGEHTFIDKVGGSSRLGL